MVDFIHGLYHLHLAVVSSLVQVIYSSDATLLQISAKYNTVT